MSEKIQINKLPVNTWNRLGVNYAEVEWEENAPAKQSITVKSGEAPEPFRLDFSEAGDSEVSFTAITEAQSYVTAKNAKKIGISAQVRAAGFYETLGFVRQGEEYLDENCPHIYMEKKL